jgi:excisionase family DNA binding protein
MQARETKWLTVPEVARELRVSRETAYALVSEGHLPAIRLGQKSIRIRRDELDAFLEEHRVGGPASSAVGA